MLWREELQEKTRAGASFARRLPHKRKKMSCNTHNVYLDRVTYHGDICAIETSLSIVQYTIGKKPHIRTHEPHLSALSPSRPASSRVEPLRGSTRLLHQQMGKKFRAAAVVMMELVNLLKKKKRPISREGLKCLGGCLPFVRVPA